MCSWERRQTPQIDLFANKGERARAQLRSKPEEGRNGADPPTSSLCLLDVLGSVSWLSAAQLKMQEERTETNGWGRSNSCWEKHACIFSTVWNTQQKKQKCALIWCKIQNKEQTVASEGETLENNYHNESEENTHFPKQAFVYCQVSDAASFSSYSFSLQIVFVLWNLS